MSTADTQTIARLTAERNAAMRMADQWRDLCEKTAAALKGADAEIARLRSPKWWCICERLTRGTACSSCGRAKPAASGRHA